MANRGNCSTAAPSATTRAAFISPIKGYPLRHCLQRAQDVETDTSALDDYRDAEPGKILHEMRYGELAHFKLIPHTPYYGTADATPLYLITLHAAWRATGDKELLEQHLETAEGCLSWIDDYGDRDGDGFQEYQTRSPAGYANMGWKDSGDSIVYADGSLVRGPKALCELQGYVYDAWIRMAEVFEALGDKSRADQLRTKASALFPADQDATLRLYPGDEALDPPTSHVRLSRRRSCVGGLPVGTVRRDHLNAVVSQFLMQRIAVTGAIADQILRLGFDHVEVEA